MKKTLIYLASILLFTSCSGFLDEEDKAGINNNKLYETEIGYETLRTNAYASLRIIYDSSPFVLLAGTDIYQLPRNTPNNGIYEYSTLYNTNGDVETFYRECYQVLQAINAADFYLSIANISEEKKALYKSEYDFLNGFIHLLLVEQFGGVPISDSYTQTAVINMPRASLEETYAHIITKLGNALSGSLPQTKKDGTICKDIVNHYLAKAHLTRGWDLNNSEDFGKARTYADAVLNTRGALKYSMENLWSPSNENNDEVLFAVQYDARSIPSNREGNNQEALFGPYLGGTERGHKYMSQQLMPSWALHSWYGENDARYEATFMLTMWEFYYDYYNSKNIPGTNKIAAVYPRVWDKAKEQEMIEDYKLLTKGVSGGKFVDVTMTVGENRNLVDGALEFIKKWCPEYNTVNPIPAVDNNGGNYLRIYPFISSFSTPKENENYWRSGYESDFAQPGIKKFDNGKLDIFDQRQSYRDIVLAGLSETMFLHAEASIALGEYPKAVEYINKVLSRPGNAKNGGVLTCALPTSSKEAALEAYHIETAKELAGQYCGRWPELRRTKMLKHMYYKYNFDYNTGRFGDDPIGVKLYRPIPQAAINLNEGLSGDDQNPGYDR
jgi:SusD family.